MKGSFYIDVDKARKLGINHLVSIRLNGRKVKRCIAAKSGKNGFVEFIPQHPKVKNEELVTSKKRGVVKVSISKVES